MVHLSFLTKRGHGGVSNASRAAAQEGPALTTAGLPALMPRRYSVRLESFYHAVKNEPHAHRGDEKTDDPGRGVYPFGADPAHHFFGIGETEVRHKHRRHDGPTDGDSGDNLEGGVLHQRNHPKDRRDGSLSPLPCRSCLAHKSDVGLCPGRPAVPPARAAPPARYGRPAGAAPSQAERGAAPLSLVLDRRRRMG